MRLLSFITKGGKEIFKQLFFLSFTLILIQFVIFMFYVFASDAHISLTNFDMFMRSLIRICTFLYLFGFFFLKVAMIKLTNWKDIYFFLFYFLPLVCILVTTSFFLEYNALKFNQSAYCLIFFSAISLLLWFFFFVGYRVIVNQLFRELFTEDFQRRCEEGSEREKFPFTIAWIKKVKHFCIRHFKNREILEFTPINDQDIFAEFREMGGVASAYKEKPVEQSYYYNGVKIRFKYTPVTFRVSDRLIMGNLN